VILIRVREASDTDQSAWGKWYWSECWMG